MSYLTCAVQWPFVINQKLVIKYKNTLFEIIPSSNRNKADNIIISLQENNLEKAYELAQEFLSAVCFTYNVKVSLGGTVASYGSAGAILYSEEREISPYFLVNDFLQNFTLVYTKEQSLFLGLYRRAFSNPDPYFSFLFYWHALVFPSENDSAAINFIDENIALMCDSTISEMNNYLFTKGKEKASLGKYFKDIRHSVAHIVRSDKTLLSLQPDQLATERHVNAANLFLKTIVQRKARNILLLSEGKDTSILEIVSL